MYVILYSHQINRKWRPSCERACSPAMLPLNLMKSAENAIPTNTIYKKRSI